MRLSIVILEYHCLEQLRPCLDNAVKNLGSIDHEFVIVSNSAYDLRKQAQIRTDFPDAECVFQSKNTGFARGVNAGIRRSRGEYVMVLNSDVALQASFAGVLDYLQKNAGIGVLGPKIIDQNGNVQDSCRRFMGVREFFLRQFHRLAGGSEVVYDRDYDRGAIQSVDWVIGACMIFPRRVWDAVGGFDEAYFLYVEDMDFCLAVKRAGFKVVYYPEMSVEYKGDRKSLAFLKGSFGGLKYSVYHVRGFMRFLYKLYFGRKAHAGV